MGVAACCVPFCTSGYAKARAENKEKDLPNPSLFSMPKVSSGTQPYVSNVFAGNYTWLP